MEFKHKSVLLQETIDNLNIRPDGIYVDGTLGGGGHSYEIASRLSSKGRLIGIDQDEAAIAAAGERLKPFADRVTIVRNNYCNMDMVLKDLGIERVDGILLDLGVSSYQLDTAERGFTYKTDAPLDMRMDRRQQMTAKDILNEYSEMELYRIIRDYGEDKFAKNIAKHIVAARSEKPIETTFELNEIIKAAIPMKCRAVGGHPGKKLLFMGQEFGQWNEWSEKRSLDWYLLEDESHKELKDFTSACLKLNKNYRCLYETDYNSEGFRWINANDKDNSVFSFIRISPDKKKHLLFVLNFTPVERPSHRIGVPIKGKYKLVLGDDMKNQQKIIASEKGECDGYGESLLVDLHRYGIAVYEFNGDVEAHKPTII